MENNSLDFLKSNIGKKMEIGLSPFGAWINGTLISANENGEIEVEILIRSEMANPLGMLHGGAIAGFMDEVMGIGLFSLGLKHFYSTINLQVEYFAPSFVNDVVILKTHAQKQGKKIVHMTCNMYMKSSNTHLAKGSSNLINIEKEMPRL
jgi:acyl-coenzyme A thioesterase 13